MKTLPPPLGYRIARRQCRGCKFTVAANLSRAEMPILVLWDDDPEETHWHGTPYQTADARHDMTQAVTLAKRYAVSAGWV